MKRNDTWAVVLAPITSLWLGACRPVENPSKEHSPPKDTLNQSQENSFPNDTLQVSDAVKNVWKNLDYLPWDYSPDGCMARSFFTGMEFAAEGILVNQQIINLRWMSGTSSTKQLFTPIDVKIKDTPQLTYKEKKVAWEYHIAALLLPPVVPEPTIIDPALETEPVSVQKWISHANSGGIAQSVLVNQQPSLGYNSFSTFASNYVGVAPSLSSNWASVSAADFKSFPAYRFSEIKLACETLAKIYTCNGNPSDPRLKTLVERTNLLASQLKLKGLLNDWDQTEIQCAPTDSFSCFNAASEPVPPKPAPTSSIRNTLVESSCIIGQSFTLAIEVSGSRSAMSVSAFPRCEILASALDRKGFPSSQPAPPTSEGGPTVKSSCNSGSLQISISVNGSQSTSSMSVGSEAVCQEIKNLINQQKI